MLRIEKSNTICLCMIVKNESHIIEKCLRSVAPLIDYYVICDTGSTDNTIDIIQKTTSELRLKGEVLRHKWVNFAHNRTLSLKAGKAAQVVAKAAKEAQVVAKAGKAAQVLAKAAKAAKAADYLLVIDADETLQFCKEFTKVQHLDKDAYNIETILGNIRFNRLQLLSTRLDWYYEGVVHEYPRAEGLRTIDKLVYFYNVSTVQGSRSRNPNKYLDDAKLLEADLLVNKDNSRSIFYLAQSYRDAKCYDKARENYIKRLSMTGYDEELIVCYSQIGFCSKMLGDSIDSYIQYYLEGYKKFPHRLECLYDYISCLKNSGNSKLAIDIGFRAALTPYPKDDQLFIIKDIYDFLFKVELANCCIEQKLYKEAIILLKYTLDKCSVPLKYRLDIYTKIIVLCELLGYTSIINTRPIEVVYNMDDLSKSVINFNTHYTQINLEYLNNNTISVCVNNNVKCIDNMDMEIVKCIADMYTVDLNVYIEKMNNDFRYIKQYKSIINFSRDIVLLGDPSYDFLEKLSKLVTEVNRIFILLYDDSVFSEDKSKLISNSWNLIIGNVGSLKLSSYSYVDIIGFSGINDLMIGWVEVCEARFTDLATL